MDPHVPPLRGLRGFTLIELLVALALMSMLAILSWRSIDGMHRTQTLTQQRADGLLRLQAALGQWGADLDAIVDTGLLSPLEFDGRVLLLTRRASGTIGLESPGVQLVAWIRTSGTGAKGTQWVRWQSPPIRHQDALEQALERAAEWATRSGDGNTTADRRDSAVALADIEQWQLFYHRGETWGNPLSSLGTESAGDAEPSTESAVPNGVRLVLTLTAGQGLSGTLVRDWVRPTLHP
jgi:general secretion pathway protein J